MLCPCYMWRLAHGEQMGYSILTIRKQTNDHQMLHPHHQPAHHSFPLATPKQFPNCCSFSPPSIIISSALMAFSFSLFPLPPLPLAVSCHFNLRAALFRCFVENKVKLIDQFEWRIGRMSIVLVIPGQFGCPIMVLLLILRLSNLNQIKLPGKLLYICKLYKTTLTAWMETQPFHYYTLSPKKKKKKKIWFDLICLL